MRRHQVMAAVLGSLLFACSGGDNGVNGGDGDPVDISPAITPTPTNDSFTPTDVPTTPRSSPVEDPSPSDQSPVTTPTTYPNHDTSVPETAPPATPSPSPEPQTDTPSSPSPSPGPQTDTPSSPSPSPGLQTDTPSSPSPSPGPQTDTPSSPSPSPGLDTETPSTPTPVAVTSTPWTPRPDTPMPDPCLNYGQDTRNLFWGDLHLHTSWSIDAYINGNSFYGPAEAYLFAKGELEYTLANGETIQLEKGKTALDFLAVTDHSEYFDTQEGCVYGQENTSEYVSSYCDDGYRGLGHVTANARYSQMISYPPDLPHDAFPYVGFDCSEDGSGSTDCWGFRINMWQRNIHAANDANSDDCSFTALIAYEYSGNADPDGQVLNQHRNVIFQGEQVVPFPLDFIHYDTPETMWYAFDEQCAAVEGCEAIMIPHNPNDSAGQKWRLESNEETNRLRAKYERLVEIYQHKGSSECLNASRTDPQDGTAWDGWCEFELATTTTGMRNDVGMMLGRPDREVDIPGYIRPGLAKGLQEFRVRGYNPLQLGIVAGTDSHNASPGYVIEEAFHGNDWNADDSPSERTELVTVSGEPNKKRYRSPGGLTAVWAPANNRTEIYQALKRRETYGTSGTRIQLWFFQVWDDEDWCSSFDPEAIRDSGAVPMGGTMDATDQQGSPRFVVYAKKDSNYEDTSGLMSHNLLEIHLIQLNVDETGTTSETVFQKVAPTTTGTATLCKTFREGDGTLTWDPLMPSAWYTRVVETPSKRWSQYDCAQSGVSCEDDMLIDINERAWSSPIWHLPPEAILPPVEETPAPTPQASPYPYNP